MADGAVSGDVKLREKSMDYWVDYWDTLTGYPRREIPYGDSYREQLIDFAGSYWMGLRSILNQPPLQAYELPDRRILLLCGGAPGSSAYLLPDQAAYDAWYQAYMQVYRNMGTGLCCLCCRKPYFNKVEKGQQVPHCLCPYRIRCWSCHKCSDHCRCGRVYGLPPAEQPPQPKHSRTKTKGG